ncbi:MmcQ/YjbR family DNA-binding protein [Streptococcus moroccensis]|uniref:DNA-binding protein (MmcQ/YjbR family) n=1 Tax=Streptococcus moroccensis TaxID=1451356 RepID=A0ABT9YQU2_9STRE|nr:MmcQ/YjbR family DNA-binding protein [Streptococcus moroccensis]MDQ0221510.1 putative DNA-binding protein (MmcQ/YjbR family) [Streptococcus moroccensis]
MSFEATFFEKKQVDWARLAAFGFVKEGESWAYRETFLENSFEAYIRVLADGEVVGEIIDLDLGEPYLAYQVVSPVGAFVNQVRDQYAQILEKIAQACFTDHLFRSDQANRLAQAIVKTYGDVPDHPFQRIPDAVVFRSPVNQKWYALFMSVTRDKVDHGKSGRSELVDILNIKIDEKVLPSLLGQDGYYPSYHMNKKSWLTIILDNSVSDEAILALVGNSRHLVSPKGYQARDGEPDYWIIPANLNLYDIGLDFATSKEQIWPHKGNIKAGDTMGIYITAPTRAMRYLCQITAIFKEGGKDWMKVSLLKTLTDTDFPIGRLSELGVTTVRGPRRMTPDLVRAVQAVLADVK